MKKLNKKQRNKIYKQTILDFGLRHNDALCIYHFYKYFPECVRTGMHYGCNKKEIYGQGQLIEFEYFLSEMIDIDNEDRFFILCFLIEMTK